MLNDELRNKISSDSPRMLSPVSIGRSNCKFYKSCVQPVPVRCSNH